MTAEKIGIETTTYVRNIFKYYAAYKLMAATHTEQSEAPQGARSRRESSAGPSVRTWATTRASRNLALLRRAVAQGLRRLSASAFP